MNLRYKRYRYSQNKSDIKKIYEQSFPKYERFPFWVLRGSSRQNNVHLECILESYRPVGMQFIVEYDDITYLMYLAVDEKYRSLGYGSQALKNLIVRSNNVILCIEKPDGKSNIKERRKNFYLRNGLYETGCVIKDKYTEYEVLSSLRNYKPTVEDLLKRYSCMSNNPFIKNVIKRVGEKESIRIK